MTSSFYIQTAEFSNNRLGYSYMGSAEFEWGSVQSTRALMRFASNVIAREVPGVLYTTKDDKGRDKTDTVMLVAPMYTLSDGREFYDLVMEDFLNTVKKDHGLFDSERRVSRFKERPHLAANLALPEKAVVEGWSRSEVNVWLAVDAFVHNEFRAKDYTDRAEVLPKVQDFWRNTEYQLKSEHGRNYGLKFPWIAIPSKILRPVLDAMNIHSVRVYNSKESPVKEEDIKMFDSVHFYYKGRKEQGKVVGLLETGIQINKGGERVVVDPSAIVKIVTKEKQS